MKKHNVPGAIAVNIDSADRRRFLLRAAAGTAALVSSVRFAEADEHGPSLPKLDESDPTATALGYRHDSNAVDAGKYPNHSAAQNCANCALYQGAGQAWGPCAIFPGKQVAADGWCAVWAPRPQG